VTVPSGNFGKSYVGAHGQNEWARRYAAIFAATNSNRTIPDWLDSGNYEARPSVATLSNAMDVGAPSNYERLQARYSVAEARKMIAGYWLDDAGTRGRDTLVSRKDRL
jgi:threonine synthase